jgi:hypothetical protein
MTQREPRDRNGTYLPTYLPTLLRVIAGMVDLIGFLRLGVFTGPLVVRHDRANPAQILAIPVAATSLIGKTTGPARSWLDASASSVSGSADYLRVDLQHHHQSVC